MLNSENWKILDSMAFRLMNFAAEARRTQDEKRRELCLASIERIGRYLIKITGRELGAAYENDFAQARLTARGESLRELLRKTEDELGLVPDDLFSEL